MKLFAIFVAFVVKSDFGVFGSPAESISTRLLGIDCNRPPFACPQRSVCSLLAKECDTSRTCICEEGFIAIGTECKKAKQLNEPCRRRSDALMHCAPSHSECRAGMCQCAPYYRKDASGKHCIRTDTAENYPCTTNAGCLNPLQCRDGRCVCQGSHKLNKRNECVEKTLGDECDSESDCYGIVNSRCIRGFCECQRDYVSFDHVVMSGPFRYSTKKACLLRGVTPGKYCNMDVSDQKVCSAGYTCLRCNSNMASPMLCGSLQLSSEDFPEIEEARTMPYRTVPWTTPRTRQPVTQWPEQPTTAPRRPTTTTTKEYPDIPKDEVVDICLYVSENGTEYQVDCSNYDEYGDYLQFPDVISLASHDFKVDRLLAILAIYIAWSLGMRN